MFKLLLIACETEWSPLHMLKVPETAGACTAVRIATAAMNVLTLMPHQTCSGDLRQPQACRV